MRQNLVFLAVACLIALPLAAASNAPVQDQAAAPAPAVSAQQAVAPVATPATATQCPLAVIPAPSVVVGACNKDSDCYNYCLERYGWPDGRCLNYKCTCYFPVG